MVASGIPKRNMYKFAVNRVAAADLWIDVLRILILQQTA